MFGQGQVTRLQLRKAALLRQSGIHRSLLATEVERLRPSAAWVDLGIDVARSLGRGWKFLAPLLALWQVGRRRSSGFIHRLANVVSLARSLLALWKSRP